jgi:outer membrane protein OmpA-like peptidoglycan-associated protein
MGGSGEAWHSLDRAPRYVALESRRKVAVSAARRLDRKTRVTVAILVAVVLAGPVLAIRNYVASVEEDRQLVALDHPSDDGLISLNNGTTIFLQSQELAWKMSQWLDVEADTKPAFELADSNFAAKSAQLTSEGQARIEQVAQVLTADPDLRAQIVVLADAREEIASRQLELARAARIRSQLLAEHVAALNVTSAVQPAAAFRGYHFMNAAGPDSHIVVVLTK